MVLGSCRVCGQPIYEGGQHRGKVISRLTWHRSCTTAYFLWTKTSDYAGAIAWRQGGKCAVSGDPIGPPALEFLRQVDVDHEVPIYRVRRDHAAEPWFKLLRYWGLGNLRSITTASHLAKSAQEAAERASRAPRRRIDQIEMPL